MLLSHLRSDNLDKVDIRLKDWLSGDCPYSGCTHNDNGICTYDDEDFMDDLLNKIQELYKTKREVNDLARFECKNIEVEDRYCKWCGNKLKKYRDMLPYGDTHVPYIYYECKHC